MKRHNSIQTKQIHTYMLATLLLKGKNAAYIRINKPGDAPWHIQFYQQPFTLFKGTTYTYSLWAKSEKLRTATMRILHQGAPWTIYATQQIILSETT